MIYFIPFLVVAIAIILTPGPDVALVTRNSLREGRSGGIKTSLGVVSGVLVWAAASAVGISVILAESALAFSVLRIAGAIYLVYLGISTLIRMKKEGDGSVAITGQGTALIGKIKSPYAQGALNNILNPKMAILFVSLIPQFISPGSARSLDSLELALLFDLMGLAWLLFFSTVIATGKNYLSIPRVRMAFEAISGSVLVALGISIGLRLD